MAYKILAVCNNKGGVGKTLVSKMIAEYAALIAGLRVLLIDLDPQCNLSRRYLAMEFDSNNSGNMTPPRHPDWTPEEQDWNGYSDSADIWMKDMYVTYDTDIPNLEILPGHAEKLTDIELVRKEEVYAAVVKRLREDLRHPQNSQDYDLVVIDTRPSKGPLVQAALHAATDLLIPSQMEEPSIEGLYGMWALRNDENIGRAKDDELNLVGILANLMDMRTSLHRDYWNEIRENPNLGGFVLPEKLHTWTDFKLTMAVDETVDGRPDLFRVNSVFRHPPTSKIRVQGEKVCHAVLHRMGLPIKVATSINTQPAEALA
ncbi:MAG: ParA family protein [Gammaproteobacteria bacterium]|nr:ParA family protein [Gammaproteobacteria bacterium]MDH5731126.1 ParA family protein [Gammaproteobacteria bacterium]